MSDRNQLSGAIDEDEANELLRSLLSTCPVETINQVARLFIDGDAPYQASALFNHAFVISERQTCGTIDSVVGFRLRDADEFAMAIRALYLEKFISHSHGEINPPLISTLPDGHPR